jgi:hypothetical protein
MSETDNLSKKLESIESKMSELTHEIDITKFKEELFEVLLIVSTLKDKEKITFYLNFFERLIKVMKIKKIWDEVDEELMKDVMTGVANNWREYGKDDLAKLFECWLKKNIVGGD